MSMTREEMDRVIDDHFRFEATDDLDGVMGSLADEVEHEIIPGPYGPLTGHARIRQFYEKLFTELSGESVTPVRRLYGDDFLIDESIWHGHVHDRGSLLCADRSGPADMRIIHVFNLRDGKIVREHAWWDAATIQRQLGCTIS
jgi:uncharacterized protein